MLEPETPLQRWILASQKALLARSRDYTAVGEQQPGGEPEPGSSEQSREEQVFFPESRCRHTDYGPAIRAPG